MKVLLPGLLIRFRLAGLSIDHLISQLFLLPLRSHQLANHNKPNSMESNILDFIDFLSQKAFLILGLDKCHQKYVLELISLKFTVIRAIFCQSQHRLWDGRWSLNRQDRKSLKQ